MIETIEFKGEVYPKFQASGFAARFIFPFAKEVCKGVGVDVGCNREEWCFPGAIPCDPNMNTSNDANRFPIGYRSATNCLDYIFSSHCLEHINEWVDTLDYWYTKLKDGGVLFLYLPHPSQKYWLPWHNRKHVNILHPKDIKAYLKDKGYKNIFVSKRDLNHSYCVMAEK